jgi:hypothetical protein
LEQVIEKVSRQVEVICGFSPKYTTHYPGLSFDPKHKFVSKDTAFVETKYGLLPHTGKLNGIYLVGSYNKSGISTIDKALEIACSFSQSLFIDKK